MINKYPWEELNDEEFEEYRQTLIKDLQKRDYVYPYELICLSWDEICKSFGLHTRYIDNSLIIRRLARYPGYVHPDDQKEFEKVMDKIANAMEGYK